MKEGEETARQGKAIMLFTVMTIIFVGLVLSAGSTDSMADTVL